MTRFDAADAVDRQKLVADAVTAHRERGSPYLTLEADRPSASETEEGDEDDTVLEPLWVQLSGDVLNLDCTDAEVERVKALLAEFPAFKIRNLESPEDVEGTNVRVGALADAARIGQFVDRVFQDVYELDSDYRLWVAEL